MASTVSKGELYPVAEEDRHLLHRQEFRLLGPPSLVRARWTSEFRAPKAGEWFLSGNPVEAYRAPNNLTIEYHIAELIVGRVVYDN